VKAARFLAIFLAACSSEAARIRPPDPAAIETLQQINAFGPKHITDSMSKAPAYSDWINQHISTGDTTWLIAASLLRPVAEGVVASSLDLAFAVALPKEPEAVLRLLGDSTSHFSVAAVCRADIVRDTVDVVRADTINHSHELAVVASLLPVLSSDLTARRDSCRSALNVSAAARADAIEKRKRR
jgi:hypothetical protein